MKATKIGLLFFIPLSGFNDVVHLCIFATAVFAYVVFCGNTCCAWQEETHLALSAKLSKTLPSYFRDIAKREEKNYLLGLKETDEIFPGEEEGEYQAGKFERRGVELIIAAVKQLDVLIRRKAPAAQVAYQMGRLDRTFEDYLEPLPGADSKLSSTEITGTRIFFEDDFSERTEKLDFLFDGYDNIKYLPTVLAEAMEKNRGSGRIIYDSYHTGEGYGAVGDEAEAAVNRTLNLIVDFYYTVDRGRTRLGKKMNLSEILGLDRFRLGADRTEKMEIKKPDDPSAPLPPKKPEAEKK
ncbi:MAG: hypothetical protein AB1546_10035 [bacterium]